MRRTVLVFVAGFCAIAADSAYADSTPLQLESRIIGMETTLPPEAGYHLSLCHIHPASEACLELAALDAVEGLAVNPTDWAMNLGGPIDSEIVVVTDPQPPHDLLITWEDGELTVCLPDTRGASHGASFAVSDDGSTWWLDLGHDGLLVGDRSSVSEAMQERHLGRSCDEPADDWQAEERRAERVEIEVTVESERAYQLALSLDERQYLAWPDGSPLELDDLGRALGEAFGLEDDGVAVSGTSWAGRTGRAEPLRAVAATLDDAGGWPEPEVVPGTVAVDLERGRLAFSGGSVSSDFQPLGHYHTHWGGGHFGAR